MGRVVYTASGYLFEGSVDSVEDVADAARIAQSCASFVVDEDDECYAAETVTCFNCRGRRWATGGFSCLRGLLPIPPQAPHAS